MVLTPEQALEYNPEILVRGVYPDFSGLSGSIRRINFSALHLKKLCLIDLISFMQ